MARSTIIECIHCQARIGLVEGIGRFAYPTGSRRSMVMRESPQADREAIEAIEQAHAIDWHRVGISRGIRECRQCRSIRSYFRTEFSYGNGQRFHSPCACPECGTPGVEWVTPYEALHCPHCNRAGFKPVGFRLMD